MLYSAIVTTDEELWQINKLNQKNLKANLSLSEQQEQGFVSWLYSFSLLKQLHSLAPSIMVKDQDKVVGYALVTPIEAAGFHPDLQAMINNLENIQYKNKPLSSYQYYVMGQVCIDKDYRGKGVFTMLFEKHEVLYKEKYGLLVTEISTANFRSQKAHENVGFKTIDSYKDPLDEWNVVVWEW